MLQSGDPLMRSNKLKFWAGEGVLSQKEIDIITQEFMHGLSMSYSINIKNLVDRYFSGFLE